MSETEYPPKCKIHEQQFESVYVGNGKSIWQCPMCRKEFDAFLRSATKPAEPFLGKKP